MLLKSISRTHHPHMHYSYTGVGAKHAIPFRSTQKYFTPTIGENTKNMPYRISTQINAPKFLLMSLESFVAEKKHVAMQKLFIKKEKKKKRWKKMDKCPRY